MTGFFCCISITNPQKKTRGQVNLKPGSRWVIWVVGVVRGDPRDRDSEFESFVSWVFLRGCGGSGDPALTLPFCFRTGKSKMHCCICTVNLNNLPAHSKRLMEIYDLFGFQQLIDKATRVTLTSKTLIDHIATTNKSNIVVSDVKEISLSDHFLVYCVRKFRGASKKQHKIISTRQMKNFSEEDFLKDLSKVDWKKMVTSTDDVSLIVEQWSNMFSIILEKHAPTRNRRVSEKFSPWLTKDFKLMCKSRDRLKKLAVRSKSEILMQAYRQMRNRVNKLNLNLKREFFTNKIASYDGDLKNTWKTINQVLNKKSKTTHITSLEVEGKTVSGDTAIAESMNDFFVKLARPSVTEYLSHLILF